MMASQDFETRPRLAYLSGRPLLLGAADAGKSHVR